MSRTGPRKGASPPPGRGAGPTGERDGFGPLLAAARKRLGLTQAGAAGRCGMPVQQWSDLENDRRQPGYKLIRKIVEGLDVPPSEFFPGREG